MAFYTFSPATFAEVISQAVNFAVNDLGWTDSGGTVLVPKTGGATFDLTDDGAAPVADTDRGYRLHCLVTDGAESFECVVDTMPAVGQCWLFGGNTPEPWLHIVISSAPGDYHHLYLGYLERYGNWTGGAIADGTMWTGGLNDTRRRRWYLDQYNHMLFSGGEVWSTVGPPYYRPGGVLVSHAEAPTGAGRFFREDYTSAAYPRGMGGFRLEGGFTDIGNRGLILPGLTSFNGVAPIAPIVLRGDFEYDGFTVPLGAVAGIRMANIEDIDPESLLDFGGRTFQVFPLANKFRSMNYVSSDPLPAWRQGGSEYMGIAVLRE